MIANNNIAQIKERPHVSPKIANILFPGPFILSFIDALSTYVPFLDGHPAIARYDVINVGDNPKEQIENGMALEIKGAATYNDGVKLCAEVKDTASRELMERMVVESEQSIDWAEAQLDLIKMIGIENYLAQQVDGGGGK